MCIYAFIPFVATLAYIPLLIVTARTRPWRKEHTLFLLFLIVAVLWSLADYIFRSNFFQESNEAVLRIVLILGFFMALQFHTFASYFYPKDKSRWLLFGYGCLFLNIILASLGIIPLEFGMRGEWLVPNYGWSVLFMVVPLLALLGRNLSVFIPRLKNRENPVLYNQTVSIILCLSVLTVFLGISTVPIGSEFPVSHVGNIIIAVILSYAVVGQQLLDVRFVLRRGFVWLSLSVIGLISFWALLMILHLILDIELTLEMTFIASVAGILSIVILFRVKNIINHIMGKAFQGDTYKYREKLVDFADKIHNVFSLNEQGSELLLLVTRAVGCEKAALLFPNSAGDYEVQLKQPDDNNNSLSELKLRSDNPIIDYLKREQSCLTRENLSILPEFLALWQQERAPIEENNIEIFIPLVSRDRLIGILVLDNKANGYYLLEDFTLLEDIADRVAVSLEKEYLREQLKEREEELSVINRSNAIITSSLDIQRIYNNFIKELKRVVDVDWASIAVIEDDEINFMALSTEVGSPWKAGERIPLKGTATEWVANHNKSTVDDDLSSDQRFTTAKYHLQHSIRSLAYIPLIISNQVIGTLIVGSRNPHAYNSRHVRLLEQLASQIAMPIENVRLYAKTERMARVDSLTGLLNRRSLDEALVSEIGRHSRYGGVFSLLIFDLDSFKTLNDSYGHLAGDEVLRQIGIIMKNTIREADQAFRYGGDEFAALLPQTSIESALKVAERIRQQTFARIEIGSTPISISLGLASWPADGVSPTDIIAAADAALYQAKRSGGNRCQCSIISLKPDKESRSKPKQEDSEETGALSAIFALANTVDNRDRLTHNHSKQVHDYALAIGEALGMDTLRINRLGTCALLHDVGKIGISDEILQKPER
jgi:diguanylate cyclase (GGDEF)-like protein